MPAAELTAEADPDEPGYYRWVWRSPWATVHIGPSYYESPEAALAGGAAFLARGQRRTRPAVTVEPVHVDAQPLPEVVTPIGAP